MSASLRAIPAIVPILCCWAACGGGPVEVPAEQGETETESAGSPDEAMAQPTIGDIRVLTEPTGQWTHNFGSVEASKPVPPHVMSFAWNGTKPLIPSALSPSCACLTAVLLSSDAQGNVRRHELGEPIEPGTVFGVRIVLDTGGLKGEVRKRIMLAFDDPPGAVRLVMVADVR